MHEHGVPTGARLMVSAGVTGAFVVAEFLIGLWANSLALMSDAGHNLTDMVALLLSAWAFWMSTRPATQSHSYGYHRVGVFAALINAVTLVGLATYIFYEAYQRLSQPEPVASTPMIVVALVALVLNTIIALALRRAGQDDVNVRSALVHMIGDAISSVGVLIAGVGVLLTGSPLWDPAVSMLIGLFILWSSWGIIRETVQIFLEGTPPGLHLDEVARDIGADSQVQDVHDLHSWSLGSNMRALSAHVVLTDPSTVTQHEVTQIVRRIKAVLASQHGIAHATIETHCADCPDSSCVSCAEQLPPVPVRPSHEHSH